MVVSTNARPIFLAQDSSFLQGLRSTNFKDLMEGFFQGVKLDTYTQITDECLDSSSDFTSQMQDAFDKYGDGQLYNGTDDFTAALGKLSPLSRHCYTSIDDLVAINIAYMKKFKNFNDFVEKISANMLWNAKHIKRNFGLILSELMVDSNYTQISFLTGQIISYSFVIETDDPVLNFEPMMTPYESPLRYLPNDPLAKDPLEQPLWNGMEGTFKFLHGSKLATKDSLLDCQEGIVNMILFTQKSKELSGKKNKEKESVFALIDGIGYSNQLFTGCVSSLSETGHTLKNIPWKKIPSNFSRNAGRIISAATATYAQVYYKDWLNLSGVVGDLFYRIVVYGAN